MPPDASDASPPIGNAVPICAIGASAGGVGALRALFRQLPEDLGLAYVVIVHLSPEHPSVLAEILSGCTKMQVHQVTDTPKLTANRVYVIPPDRELVIEGDSVTARVHRAERATGAGGHVLPLHRRRPRRRHGRGAHRLGLRRLERRPAIEEASGVVFAQEPAEAEFPAMPRNAIATGVVSFIAPIDRHAERIARIAEVSRSKQAVRSLDADGAANDLRRIVGFLRARTGHDAVRIRCFIGPDCGARLRHPSCFFQNR